MAKTNVFEKAKAIYEYEYSEPSLKAYKPSKVLITGGCGFIASNVLCKFVMKYPEVKFVNVDKLDYCASLKNLKELECGDSPEMIEYVDNYKFYLADITDFHAIDKIFEKELPDTIMHFAAHTHVDNSFGNSFHFTQNNIYGTHVLLEVAKKYNIKRFIHVSTDEVYGEFDEASASENSILNPTNPYSASKAGAEFIARSYYKSFNLPLIITRGNNVYGPKQYPEKLIPKFITLLNKGLPCPIHGKGLEKRSFIYVDDVVNAFDVILHYGKIGEIYNIGTNEEISNIDVAKKLLELYGNNASEKLRHSVSKLPEASPYGFGEDKLYYVENRCFNDLRYTLNTSKLNNLGWKVNVDFDEGLKRTIEWYDNVLSEEAQHPYRLNENHDGAKHWENIDEAIVPHPRLNQGK